MSHAVYTNLHHYMSLRLSCEQLFSKSANVAGLTYNYFLQFEYTINQVSVDATTSCKFLLSSESY